MKIVKGLSKDVQITYWDNQEGFTQAKDLLGQYFYGEPVARIVRQIRAEVKDGLTTLHNVYQDQKSEFIRSTDPLFRPVDMATAPDGTMYIVDMYHGIIQEGEWTPVGSYLRAKIEQYQLDKVVSLGRIWRLMHTSMDRDKTVPRMYDQTSLELLAHLNHPNGWWRDMAQQILVQRQDKSVTGQLQDLVKHSDRIETKFHALWTLEGLGTLDSALVQSLLKDPNPRMRKVALWVSESLYKAGIKSFASSYIKMMSDPDTDVKLRAMMTGRLLKIPGTNEAIKKIIKRDTTASIQLVGKQVLEPQVVNAFFGRSNPNFNDVQKAMIEKGSKIYSSICATCHGALGNGTPAGVGKLMAPSLIGSPRVQAHPDYVVKTLLHGLMGPIQKESYAGIMMAPMGKNTDDWIASIVSFIRTNFENESSVVSPEDVARVRRSSSHQTKMYTFDSLWAGIPQVLEPLSSWKVTASHTGEIRKGSTASPRGAFNFEGWTTGVTQKAGMWYKIELPVARVLTEIHFKSQAISRGFRPGSPAPIQTAPSEYDLDISMDGIQWTNMISKGVGQSSSMQIRFEPTQAKFLRLTLTKSASIIHGERRGQPYDYEIFWTMRELKLYAIQ